MACGRSCTRVCPALGNSSRRAIQHLPGYGYKLGTWPFLQQSGLLLPCRRLQWKWNYPRYCHRFNKSSLRKLNASQPVTFLISTRCVGRKNVLSPQFQRVVSPVSMCCLSCFNVLSLLLQRVVPFGLNGSFFNFVTLPFSPLSGSSPR